MTGQSFNASINEGTELDPVGRLLKIAEVIDEIGLSRAQVYRLMRSTQNPFPSPIKIGSASRWAFSEVIEWKRRALQSRGRK